MSNALGGKEILCTIGPASLNDRVLNRLEDIGVSLFRINLSHAKIKDLARTITFIQQRSSVPVCLDTEGAQIRTGDIAKKQLLLKENTIVHIPDYLVAGSEEQFNLYPLEVIKEFRIGDLISIDFNSVLTQVVEVDEEGLRVRVLIGGVVGQNKAVSADRDIPMPALTAKDREALTIGKEMGIRHFALSFANRGSDVEEIREIIGKNATLISKIESRAGLCHIREICARSSALLLDRGDLSRQLSIEEIPRAQKHVIRVAKECGVKIYVATNLLESMIHAPMPTRAEVNDVFNTLADGADGLVLAAETAIGAHPIECAKMIAKVIREYSNFQKTSASFQTTFEPGHSLLLVEPHGGVLVDRIDPSPDLGEIERYRRLNISIQAMLDVEQIAIGSFSPLEGFLDEEDLMSVLDHYKLSSGLAWPLPIVLQLPACAARKFSSGEKIALCLENDKGPYATLEISRIYDLDLREMALKMFGMNDHEHPGVYQLQNAGEYFLAGKIELIRRLSSEYKYLEITPRQARAFFYNKGWSQIAGFHTRNVVHRAHEYIQMLALEKYHCDGIFIHPLVGPKKKGDYSSKIILGSYELMLQQFYPKGKALLAAFQTYPRYGGPREAVFTAICRKNFGCSHFIVGRNHSGIEKYHEVDDAHKLFDRLGDIGIKPIFFNTVYYCQTCKQHVEQCDHGQDALSISGTQGREMLRAGEFPPEWFMRKEVASFIMNEISHGKEVFV